MRKKRKRRKVKQKRFLVGLEVVERDEIEITARNKIEAEKKALNLDAVCYESATVDYVEEIND